MQRERRTAPRYEIRQMVRLSRGAEEFIPAGAVNISRNGLLCRTEKPVDPGTSLYLMITLPEGATDDHVSIEEAMVVRCFPAENRNGYQCGISFLRIGDKDRTRLNAMLASLPHASGAGSR